MRSFASIFIIIAALLAFAALVKDTTASGGTVANFDGEHQQLILTLCFGIFLVCGTVAFAPKVIVDVIKRR